MYENEINQINNFLKGQLWMDFEICAMDRGKVELYGFLDEAGADKIKIDFILPHMISCNFAFTYEGKHDFISVIDGEEAYRINMEYGVTHGNVIFKLSNINVDADMIIIAKGIEVQIM